MKKFLLKLIYLLPIAIVVVGVNYYIDPGHIFQKGRYERQIAYYVTQNKYVANVTNYDGRLVQKYTIESLKYKPTVCVMSSSRGQFINSDIFPKEKLLNSWVQSAALEDFLALYDLYEKNNIKPKQLILTLDPRMLNENSPRKLWHSISPNYYSMLRKLNIKYTDSVKDDDGNLDKNMQLISLSYFQDALKDVYQHQVNVYPTTERYNKGNTRAPDGSLVYGNARRKITVLQVRKNAVEFIEAPVSMEKNYDKIKFTEFSQKDVESLNLFVDYVKKQGVEVVVFLSPYHPLVYDYFASTKAYKKVIEAEQFYQNFAKQKGIKCIGSYNPKKYGLGEEYFFDGIHSQEQCARVIFEKELINNL